MSDRYGSRHDTDSHDRKLEEIPHHLRGTVTEAEQDRRDREPKSVNNPNPRRRN